MPIKHAEQGGLADRIIKWARVTAQVLGALAAAIGLGLVLGDWWTREREVSPPETVTGTVVPQQGSGPKKQGTVAADHPTIDQPRYGDAVDRPFVIVTGTAPLTDGYIYLRVRDDKFGSSTVQSDYVKSIPGRPWSLRAAIGSGLGSCGIAYRVTAFASKEQLEPDGSQIPGDANFSDEILVHRICP